MSKMSKPSGYLTLNNHSSALGAKVIGKSCKFTSTFQSPLTLRNDELHSIADDDDVPKVTENNTMTVK